VFCKRNHFRWDFFLNLKSLAILLYVLINDQLCFCSHPRSRWSGTNRSSARWS
jgi:hypothetical protein